MDQIFQIPLDNFNFNGVIHVGAGIGEWADFYYKLGVHEVVWFEKNSQLYNGLYAGTKNFGMKQHYNFVELTNANKSHNAKTFKAWWREHAAFIDIDRLDLVHIACKNGHLEILEGFQDLIKFPRAVIVSTPIDNKTLNYLEKTNDHRHFILTEYTSGQCAHNLFLPQ